MRMPYLYVLLWHNYYLKYGHTPPTSPRATIVFYFTPQENGEALRTINMYINNTYFMPVTQEALSPSTCYTATRSW